MKNIFCYRAIFAFIALCFFLNSASALAEIKTLDEAITVAGKQRTLTQQMLKNYSLIGVNVRARKARQQLEKEIVLFDKQFFELKEFYKDAQGQQKLAATNDLWQEIRKFIMRMPVFHN